MNSPIYPEPIYKLQVVFYSLLEGTQSQSLFQHLDGNKTKYTYLWSTKGQHGWTFKILFT